MALIHPITVPGGVVVPSAYWRVEHVRVFYGRKAAPTVSVSLLVWRDQAAREANEAPIPAVQQETLDYATVLATAGGVDSDDALRAAVYTLLSAEGGPMEGAVAA